jgi:7-keto-8-aminopelargonate synthetase-like enzyme
MALSDDLKKDLQKAVSSVGGYVAARETEINELIERAAGKVDQRTEQRYSSTIDKVRAGLHTGVARLAEQKPDEPQGPAGSAAP